MLKALMIAAALVVPAAVQAADPVAASAPNPTLAPAMEAVLEQHIQPRHARFHEAATALHDRAEAFCAAPADDTLAGLRTAYGAAMDGWAGVQHLTIGPITDFERRFRLEFWPDDRNVLGRELSRLLQDKPEDILKPYGFTFASVAIQGLPMVERLAFDPDVLQAVAQTSYRCRLLVAVTANVQAIAGELQAGWKAGGNSYGQSVYDAATESDLFGTTTDLAGLFITGLSTQIHAVREQKLAPAVDGKGNPRALENWRSGRSLDTIVSSLEAVAEMYRLAFLPALRATDPDFARLMENAFAQTLGTARALTPPLSQAVKDAGQRKTIAKLMTELKALRQLAGDRTAKTLGITLGFNSLDGD